MHVFSVDPDITPWTSLCALFLCYPINKADIFDNQSKKIKWATEMKYKDTRGTLTNMD